MQSGRLPSTSRRSFQKDSSEKSFLKIKPKKEFSEVSDAESSYSSRSYKLSSLYPLKALHDSQQPSEPYSTPKHFTFHLSLRSYTTPQDIYK